MSSKRYAVQLENRDATQRKARVTSSEPRLRGTPAPNKVTGSLVVHISSRGSTLPLCIASSALIWRARVLVMKSSSSLMVVSFLHMLHDYCRPTACVIPLRGTAGERKARNP